MLDLVQRIPVAALLQKAIRVELAGEPGSECTTIAGIWTVVCSQEVTVQQGVFDDSSGGGDAGVKAEDLLETKCSWRRGYFLAV